MKRVLLSVILICCTLSLFGQMKQVELCDLQEGDLLFVVNTRGNAITAVTSGTSQLPIDHVGVFSLDSLGWLSVLEANYDGVVETKLMSFCHSDSAMSPEILVGRVQGLDVEKSLANVRHYLGRPYDHYYSDTDSEIYCSELVQKSFVDSVGNFMFSTIPMTFRDKSGKIPSYWKKLYKKRGMTVPEGAPGTNPGELSRRQQIALLGFLNVH